MKMYQKTTAFVILIVIWTYLKGIATYSFPLGDSDYITHPLAWDYFQARLHEDRMNLLATRMENEAWDNFRRPVTITVEHPIQFLKVKQSRGFGYFESVFHI